MYRLKELEDPPQGRSLGLLARLVPNGRFASLECSPQGPLAQRVYQQT
jgi:hypothetical protein